MEFGEFGLIQSHVASSVPIRDKPYQADWDEIHTNIATGDRRRAWGRVYRDSRGRSRHEATIEAFLPGGRNLSSTTLSDPVTRIVKIIDSETRRPIQIDVGRIHKHGVCSVPGVEGAARSESIDSQGREVEFPDPPPPREGGQPQRPLPPAVEALGERFIEGMRCRGSRESDGQGTLEEWISESLVVVVLLARYRTHELEIVYRLFNIHLVEPDPSLFEAVDVIPSGN